MFITIVFRFLLWIFRYEGLGKQKYFEDVLPFGLFRLIALMMEAASVTETSVIDTGLYGASTSYS